MSLVASFVAVAIGGSAGACARYAVTLLLANNEARIPYGTLIANLSGALLAGILLTVFVSRGLANSPLYFLLVTGFLGSYTTLSAFSVETLQVFQQGDPVAAIVNISATVIGALGAALLGIWLARLIV